MTKAKILIVEDEGIVAMDIRNRLKRFGYDVPAIASCGEDALRAAIETGPDLVLMDIMLSGEMDGIEAAHRIQDRLGIPVVYLTAHADELTIQRAGRTKPLGYIVKPFDDVELQDAIRASINPTN